MTAPDLILGLPGEALLWEGLADFQSGRCTIPACLVGIAQSRLRRAGLITGVVSSSIPEPERQLYRLPRQEGGDPYSRYNALIRELVSFEQALDRRQTRKLSAGTVAALIPSNRAPSRIRRRDQRLSPRDGTHRG